MASPRRRPFRDLGVAAIVGLAALMGGARSDAQPTLTVDPNPLATTPVLVRSCLFVPRVRRSIATLTPAQINALRNGVANMKLKPATDPTSWLYQANIHGTFDTPVKTAWSSCQHNSFFFLSWHRMYLYFFERILRKASGDTSFNLPYWNYSDPTQRFLPVPYRSPGAGPATNSLFVAQRAPGMNAGTAALSSSAVSFASAFAFINFDSASASFTRRLEGTPHGVVHTGIGGATGFMSSFQFAARDPIFWAHHANIDRLWNRWLQQGGGRKNPTDSTWLNTEFTFFNENGAAVKMKGSQIVSTVSQLCYRYDDDPPVFPVLTQRSIAVAREVRHEVVSATPERVELGASPVRVSLPVAEPSRPKLARALADFADEQVMLTVEGVEFEKFPGIYYEVYLNVPDDVTPNPDSILYAGNLQFFGVEPHAAGHGEAAPAATQTFDITANARALKEAGLWNEGNVSVTLVPRGLTGKDGQPLPAQPASKVVVGKISVATE